MKLALNIKNKQNADLDIDDMFYNLIEYFETSPSSQVGFIFNIQ